MHVPVVLLALTAAVTVTATPCTSSQLLAVTQFWKSNVSTACAATFKTTSVTMFDSFDIRNRLEICQAPCSADRSRLTANTPVCDETVGITPVLEQINKECDTSNAETAATSAMLVLGVFLAWGAL